MRFERHCPTRRGLIDPETKSSTHSTALKDGVWPWRTPLPADADTVTPRRKRG